MTDRLTVHLRVLDARTHQPTPVRLRIDLPEGRAVPFGRYAEIPHGRGELVGAQLLAEKGIVWYSIDGSAELELPTGVPITFHLSKGPAYLPTQQVVTLGPGQITLRLVIQPHADFPAQEWIAGDARLHGVEPHTALLEARAEGVEVSQLLITAGDTPSQDGKVYRTAPFLAAFSGNQTCLERDRQLLAVNTLNTHPVLGRLGLLHAHRPIYPLTFGDMEESDDWSLCDWCDQCHRKTGLVTWCDPFLPEPGLLGGEALVAAVLGKIDAFEISATPRKRPALAWYYPLLNAGVRLPLVGSSGKENNFTPVGAFRTWVRRGTGPTLTDWIDAIRSGTACVSNQLPLELSANGVLPGSILRLEQADQPIQVRIRNWGDVRSSPQLVINGEVKEMNATESSIPLPHGGWIAARIVNGSGSWIHTSPIYVEVPDQPRFVTTAGVHLLLKGMEATRDWIENVGRFRREKSRTHLLQHVHAAETILRDRLHSARN